MIGDDFGTPLPPREKWIASCSSSKEYHSISRVRHWVSFRLTAVLHCGNVPLRGLSRRTSETCTPVDDADNAFRWKRKKGVVGQSSTLIRTGSGDNQDETHNESGKNDIPRQPRKETGKRVQTDSQSKT